MGAIPLIMIAAAAPALDETTIAGQQGHQAIEPSGLGHCRSQGHPRAWAIRPTWLTKFRLIRLLALHELLNRRGVTILQGGQGMEHGVVPQRIQTPHWRNRRSRPGSRPRLMLLQHRPERGQGHKKLRRRSSQVCRPRRPGTLNNPELGLEGQRLMHVKRRIVVSALCNHG